MKEQETDAPQPEPAGDAPAEEAAARRADLERERDDLRERYQRSLAEFENARKRHQREMAEHRQYAISEFARELLPVLDNLERALEGVAQERQGDPFVQGVRLVEEQLLGALKAHGVTPVKARGERFDPMLHEAVQEEERHDLEPGTVTDELCRGFLLGDRLLRAAVVKVARSPERRPESSPAAPADDNEDRD